MAVRLDLHLNVLAVSREVQLDDKAWDVFAVADPVQRRSQREIVEVHRTLNRTHRQEAVVWAEPEAREEF